MKKGPSLKEAIIVVELDPPLANFEKPATLLPIPVKQSHGQRSTFENQVDEIANLKQIWIDAIQANVIHESMDQHLRRINAKETYE